MKHRRSIFVPTGAGPLRSLACAGALLWCSAAAFAGGPETKYDSTGDAAFRERGGVEMPGRWVWAGISWKSAGRGTAGSRGSSRGEPTARKRVEVSG